MGRLVSEALIGNDVHNLHHVRDCLVGDGSDPLSGKDYEGLFSRASRRAVAIDPDLRETAAVLRDMQREYSH